MITRHTLADPDRAIRATRSVFKSRGAVILSAIVLMGMAQVNSSGAVAHGSAHEGEQNTAPIVRATDTTIYFRGRIDREQAQIFVREMESRPRDVVITSPGGDEIAAMEMGEAILRHNRSVTAERFCLSGCFNTILVAARHRIVAPGTLIGIHGSAVASMQRYAKTGLEPPAPLPGLVERYRKLYGERRVDLDILRCAADQIGMTYQHVDATANGSGQYGGWGARYNFWVPSKADLHRFGVDIAGGENLPKSDEERRAFVIRAGIKPSIRLNWKAAPPSCP